MIEISLVKHEQQVAIDVGTRRNMNAIDRNLPDKHGHDGSGWNLHIEGACGEMAVAKCLNRYWSGSWGTFKSGGDVGLIQVRTRTKHHYDLIVREDDRDDDWFILVTGLCPNFRIHGYIQGKVAKSMDDCVKTHGNRPPAWFIPRNRLMPIGVQ